MNLTALKALIKLLAHAAADTVTAIKDPGGAAAKLADFSNLVPDIMNLAPQLGNISFSGLAPADYVALVSELATDLAIPDAHAAGIVNASLKIIEDLVPDVQALIAAIKAAPPAVAAVAPPAAPAAPAS